MIVVATLLCDRKRASEMVAIPALLGLRGDCAFYVNYETADAGAWWASRQKIVASGRPYAFDFWQRESTWHKTPAYDQDQSRLESIVIARNMALSYAKSAGASHILFVDSDVIVNPDGIERLLAHDRLLCGGLVPGRGAHERTGQYVFGERWRKGNVINCAHGTCGYMLIAREVFGLLPFRWGVNRDDTNGGYQSEDPLYCNDAVHLFGERGEFWIDAGATAQHWDDPANPLTLEAAVNDYHV